MNQKPDDINCKMDKNQDEDDEDEEDEDDHKPSAQEKRQDNNDEDISDSREDEPSKKKTRKESFSLGCEVLCQYLNLMTGSLVIWISRSYKRKLRKLSRYWLSLMPSEESINGQLVPMKTCISGIKKSMGLTHCISICQ